MYRYLINNEKLVWTAIVMSLIRDVKKLSGAWNRVPKKTQSSGVLRREFQNFHPIFKTLCV